MDVFGDWVIADLGFAFQGGVVEGYGVESFAELGELVGRDDAGGGDGRGVGLAGGHLFIEELPVEDDRSLPGFEFWIEWLAEAAGPHF